MLWTRRSSSPDPTPRRFNDRWREPDSCRRLGVLTFLGGLLYPERPRARRKLAEKLDTWCAGAAGRTRRVVPCRRRAPPKAIGGRLRRRTPAQDPFRIRWLRRPCDGDTRLGLVAYLMITTETPEPSSRSRAPTSWNDSHAQRADRSLGTPSRAGGLGEPTAPGSACDSWAIPTPSTHASENSGPSSFLVASAREKRRLSPERWVSADPGATAPASVVLPVDRRAFTRSKWLAPSALPG